MLNKRGLWILLLVGLLALPLLYATFEGSQRTVHAEPKAPCTTCIWLPLLAQDTKQGTDLQQPLPTPTPVKPPPDGVAPTPQPPSGVPVVTNPNIPTAAVTWKMGELIATAPGTTFEMAPDPARGFPGGTMMSGYTLEALAASAQSDGAPEGKFKLTLSAFKPNADYFGQHPGVWYVQGTWKMIQAPVSAADAAAISAALKVRHNPYSLGGSMRAELSFNPATGQGNWTGLVTLPMSPAAGRWSRGTGTFSLDADAQADIYMNVLRWPEMP
jgi:hypothetical protein